MHKHELIMGAGMILDPPLSPICLWLAAKKLNDSINYRNPLHVDSVRPIPLYSNNQNT